MIERIKLYSNNNELSNEILNTLNKLLIENGFKIDNNNYDLAVAIGGDGSFLRMLRENNFNTDIYYVGINTGTLGFMQEIKPSELDNFISMLKNNDYKIKELNIEEINISYDENIDKVYSLNEVLIREENLDTIRIDVNINNDYLEKYVGDGLMISTQIGSTAYNLCLGGSIVYDDLKVLQITPIAPINSKVYRSIINPIILNEKSNIILTPSKEKNNILITYDGINKMYNNVDRITISTSNNTIKCLRTNNYSFTKIINEKL